MIGNTNRKYYNKNAGISPNLFRKQIQYLKNKYDIISIDEAYNRHIAQEEFCNNLVITFDDGFKEMYDVVFPILKSEQVPATFYLIGNCIDNKNLMWRNKLEYLINTNTSSMVSRSCQELAEEYNLNPTNCDQLMVWSENEWEMSRKDIYSDVLWNKLVKVPLVEFLEENKPYLSIQNISEMMDKNMTFGNHSYTHPVFSKLSLEETISEIVQTNIELKNNFNIELPHFSFPFGIKPNENIYNQLIQSKDILFKSIVGTRNNFTNFSETNLWERDRLEVKGINFFIRFYAIPIIRKMGFYY